MADRFPGGVISKTPPAVSGPAPGSSGTASGVWTLDEVLGYVQAGIWPGAALPLPNLYAWGQGSGGALGTNSVANTSSPVQVGELDDWAQASAGTGVLALTTGNALYAWGNNGGGSVGDGTAIDKSSPVQIGALTNWSQVSAGGDGASGAVKQDNTLWMWGRGPFGALGDGTTVYKSSPVQIGSADWGFVAVGRQHVLAVKTNGALYAWGSNGQGRLGDGTTVYRSSPVQVGALTNWETGSGGGYHTAAIKTDGTLWAWGYNGTGALGDGTRVYKSSPIQVGALTTWSQVSASRSSTLAVKTDGTLWAWGNNDFGVLGLGNTANRSSPVQVGALTNWSSVKGMNGANGDTCSAIKTDGTLWTWGRGEFGGLGDGTVVPKSSPVQVGSLTIWSSVSTGSNFAAAIITG
jgi:alpha-tubulin suppressor-like RCC1 family protein